MSWVFIFELEMVEIVLNFRKEVLKFVGFWKIGQNFERVEERER